MKLIIQILLFALLSHNCRAAIVPILRNTFTTNTFDAGIGGAIPYFDYPSGKFVVTPLAYTSGIYFEPVLGFLSVFHTNTTGDVLLVLQEGGIAGPSIQAYSDRLVVANTNLSLDAVGPYSIRLRMNGSNVLEVVPGAISLSGNTNLIADSGTALTYNGVAIGGGGAPAGTVINSVATAGLLAVDSSKTNGIAATLEHMTNALGLTGSTITFLRSDGNQATPPGSSPLWSSAGGVLSPSPAVNVVRVESQLADNATNVALVVDTDVTWTGETNKLLWWKNNGVSQAWISKEGSFIYGDNYFDFWGPLQRGDAFVNLMNVNKGDPGHAEIIAGVYNDSFSEQAYFTANVFWTNWLDFSAVSISNNLVNGLKMTVNPGGTVNSTFLVDDVPMVVHDPMRSSNPVNHFFDTAPASSGNIFAVLNGTTNKVTSDYLGRLSIQGQTNLIGDSGSALTYNGVAIGGGAPVGTMVESGIVTAGVVPMSTGTTGTNYVASPMQGSGTNVAFNGNITASNLTATNMVASIASGSASTPALAMGASKNTGFYGGGNLFIASGGAYAGFIFSGGITIPGASYFGFESAGAASSADLFLSKDAPARFQQGQDAASPVSPQIIAAADGLGTDKNGSDYQHSGGRGTGTGRGGALSGKTSLTTTTGSTVQTESTRYYHSAKFVDLTESTATLFANVALASSKYLGVRLNCTVSAADAADFQAVNSNVSFAAVNKAGTVTVGAVTQNDDATAASAGTLTVTYTAVANGAGVGIKANAVSSLTQTQLRVKWSITSLNSDDLGTITAQ